MRELYKYIKKSGGEIYFEKIKPQHFDGVGNEGEIFVTSRTDYPTSIYCQIESCGWVDKSKLIPFKNTKKDNKIQEQIEKIIQKGIDNSEKWYMFYKVTQTERKKEHD